MLAALASDQTCSASRQRAAVASAAAEAFGAVHYKANFGLLFTQSLAYSATILIITQVSVIYAALGYTGMFLLAGAIGVIGVINNLFLPSELSV